MHHPMQNMSYMDIDKNTKILKESLVYAWTGSTKRLQHVAAFPEIQDKISNASKQLQIVEAEKITLGNANGKKYLVPTSNPW